MVSYGKVYTRDWTGLVKCALLAGLTLGAIIFVTVAAVVVADLREAVTA